MGEEGDGDSEKAMRADRVRKKSDTIKRMKRRDAGAKDERGRV